MYNNQAHKNNYTPYLSKNFPLSHPDNEVEDWRDIYFHSQASSNNLLFGLFCYAYYFSFN